MALFGVTSFVFFVFFTVTNGSPTGLDSCSRCQKMITLVNMMVNEQTRNEILDTLCESLSAKEREMCSELSQLSPTQLCQQFGQCAPRSLLYESSSKLTTDLDLSDMERFRLPCLLCQNIMKIAQAFLKSKDHQKFLKHVLKSVCHFIPFLTKKCVYFVDTYGSLAIHLIARYLTPESCKLFHICPANNSIAFTEDECTWCRLGVGVIYDTVQDPALETRIQELTQDVCEEYVESGDECESMAKELTPYLIPVAEELRHSDFFKNACERANICSDDENDVTIDY
ncbi:prosaposin-like [Mercenaria mercenaria]|uniref:prosaposin-like n=1 Tax=Mercenaria mercenaria TaxID=6596 RepID=UPI00234E891D|nr:prosaposin-like [Mercenaria mercenaria]